MPLTIENIAALAEVSRSTVSRVLNNHPGVQPAVRERVQRVIREQNYVPKAAARSLASSRTDTIGLLIPRSAAISLRDPFIESMIQSIFEASAQQHYFAMLAMLTADMESAFYHRILRSRHFDGLIMFSSDIDDPILPLLIKDGGPLVLIGRHPYFLNVVSVDVNNREGAREAVNHLIALGHRRIGLINGQLQMEAALARRDGYKQALLEAGIGIDAGADGRRLLLGVRRLHGDVESARSRRAADGRLCRQRWHGGGRAASAQRSRPARARRTLRSSVTTTCPWRRGRRRR